jgi:hypothetical protein
MTFFLDSGLEIRVPNDQFMVPFVDIDRSGKQIMDNSKREFLMNPLGSQPATLGRYFLTAAYLMVNHDANSFTMWQANPTTSSDLIPVYDEKAVEECRGGVPGVVQPSASASSPPTPTSNGSDDGRDQSDESLDTNGISPAVIGGAAGGGAALLVLIGVGAFLTVRRKRRRQADTANVSKIEAPNGTGYYDTKYKSSYGQHDRLGAQEVAGSEPGSYEVSGSEGHRYFELDTGDYTRRI